MIADLTDKKNKTTKAKAKKASSAKTAAKAKVAKKTTAAKAADKSTKVVKEFPIPATPDFKVDRRHGRVQHNGYVSKDLIDFYRPLVKSTVNRMMAHLPSHVDSEDLMSVGLMGLIAATKRYSEDCKDTFKAYVKMRIRGAIYDELRRLDCLPRSARAKVRKVQDATSKLEQELGRTPTQKEIREELDLNEKQYRKLLTRARPISHISLDGTIPTIGSGETKSLHEVIADENTTAMPEVFSKRELVSILAERIDGMPERHRQILAMYYFEGMRISEIAKVFKITEARVCQIQSYALGRLRKYAHAILN